MPEPEIRELRYFRAVADELNITRAAQRLGIAQPPLSRALRQLERRLGVDLFDRSGPRLALTPAGEVLVAESTAVLDAVDSAVRRTRRASTDRRGTVVTAKPGVATALLHQVCALLRAEPGAPGLRVVLSGFGEQADLVRAGDADVAISGCVDDRGLDTELLHSEPRVAALATGHPLARREVLTVADLATEPAPRWRATTRVDRAGRPLDHGGPVVRDTAELLEVIALRQAAALVPASLAEHNIRPDVTYRTVSDAPPYRTLLLWPAGSSSPHITRFRRAAHAINRTTADPTPD